METAGVDQAASEAVATEPTGGDVGGILSAFGMDASPPVPDSKADVPVPDGAAPAPQDTTPVDDGEKTPDVAEDTADKAATDIAKALAKKFGGEEDPPEDTPATPEGVTPDELSEFREWKARGKAADAPEAAPPPVEAPPAEPLPQLFDETELDEALLAGGAATGEVLAKAYAKHDELIHQRQQKLFAEIQESQAKIVNDMTTRQNEAFNHALGLSETMFLIHLAADKNPEIAENLDVLVPEVRAQLAVAGSPKEAVDKSVKLFLKEYAISQKLRENPDRVDARGGNSRPPKSRGTSVSAGEGSGVSGPRPNLKELFL